MTLRGHIENGTVVLDEPNPLPEGTVVEVLQVRSPSEAVRTIAERYAKIIGVIDDLPEDFADQHDHYIHGSPKK